MMASLLGEIKAPSASTRLVGAMVAGAADLAAQDFLVAQAVAVETAEAVAALVAPAALPLLIRLALRTHRDPRWRRGPPRDPPPDPPGGRVGPPDGAPATSAPAYTVDRRAVEPP